MNFTHHLKENNKTVNIRERIKHSLS